MLRRNTKDHPWDCLERSCSSPADLLCTREGRRGSCAASVEEERRGALPTIDDVDLGDAGIRGALARGGRRAGEDSSGMPMMPCGGRCGRHSLTRALSCLRPLAGEYGCGRRSTAGEGRREADRAEGTESRENRLGSGGANGRGPWPPMRKPAGGRAVGGGRRVAQLLAGGRRRAAGRAAGGAQARKRVAERRRRSTGSRGFASAPVWLSRVDARTDLQSDGWRRLLPRSNG